MRVELRPIDRTNLREVLKMKVLESESDFVAANYYSLSEAYVEPGLIPRAIYASSKLVGFIMFGRWAAAEDYWITRLMIPAEHRGKGYAKDAVRLAIAELFELQDCDRVSISFVPENKAARGLYESLGFRECGMIEEEIRYELIR